MPEELQGTSRPVLSFVGGLNDWAHDWSLLEEAARLRPTWTFLLIGPLSVSRKTEQILANHPNILGVGQKAYQMLRSYLIHSDVCFQFYRQERGNDTRNSQKLFLYFAAGKPVVSTRSADVLAYADEISLADRPADFVAAVEEVLRTDSPEKVRHRQKIAEANSWTVRVQQIGEILKSGDSNEHQQG